MTFAPQNNSQLLGNEMRFLRKMEGETNRNRIRNQAMKMGLGVIPIIEMTELVQFRWFGRVIRCPKMAWQKTGEETPTKTPTDLGRRNEKDFEGKRN
jgi:hypothetical protein